ncbi:MAG: T9SS type A sorting domain-containing protein [Chitinophagaceae bacterium]|nr:MAG: T9SS type A sorting domain-containing protein [Chitinophagaceae bacterium]
MKKLLLLVGFCLALTSVFAQTSWKGTVSTSWSNASNWTNGVPNSTKAAVLGDASFTGSFQPKVGTTAACAGLTLGGNRVCTLTLSRNLTIAGNLLVNGGSGQQAGHISQGKVSMSVTGNITINGTYAPSHNSANIIFSGTAQTFTTTPNTFRKVTVNANSVVTVNSSFAPAGTFSVAGTLNPLAGVTIGGAPAVKSTGTLKVNATNFANNYSGTATLSAGSTVDYCATANQNVAALNYSLLRISGSGTKTVVAAITISSASSAYGSVNVAAGTLDLGTMTLNRNASGAGTFSVANGATLRVGDASNFPASFLSYSLPLNSTVEYYRANNQTVAGGPTYGNLSYGNLILSGSGTKTLPSSATTVTGALTLNGSVTAQASANLTVTGVTTLSAGTTLNGGTFTIQTGNNVVNDGTINGNTGTFNLAGAGATVSSTASGVFNFNNLSILASGTSSAVPTINVSGNLATTGSGVFTHSSGTIVMTGAGKTISGSGLTLNNLTVNGTGTTAAGMTLSGNLAVSGGLSTSDVLVMNGSGKTISGAGTISFATLSATGTISTATNFTVTNTLDVTGGFTASAGTATFSGTTLFNGSANLFNVTLGSTSSLQLAANSSMGIGGALTVPAGATFNATTTTPNTVSYNSTGAQNVTGVTYDNLVLTGGNTKTSTGAFITNTDLTIASGTTFAAATFTDSIKGNWNNNGIFNAGSSTIALAGPNDATITGATTFATLTVNKSSSTNSVFLSSNVTTPTLNMTNGILRTGSNKVTITGTRTGNGYIYGTIERSHAFSSATNYAFEGPDNYINFTGASGITGVTMVVSQGSVSGFPFGAAINRSYTISLASGSYTSALLRLHYEDAEKNGNDESNLKLYRYNGSSWTDKGVSGSNTTTNYAEQTAATPDLAGTWTLSTTSTVLTWTGAQSTDWATAANWNVSGGGNAVPTAADIVQIGTIAYGANHPLVTSAAVAKSIQFGSAQAAILNLGTNGSLSTQGNISGSWSANATHTINTNGQNLTVNGGLVLSDGSTGHAINLNIGTGTVALTGSLTQGGGAAIAFTGAGNLKIGGDFTYTSGTFTAGSGTVTYNGGNFQSVGGVTYNQLIIDKTAATATTNPLATTTVTGNLTVKAGTFDFSGPTIIAGDVTVNSGAFATNRTTIAVGGNWNNNGTYIPNGGAATFNGTGAQSVSSTSFNKIIVNKPSGVLSLAGNITLNSDFLINAGTVNLGTFTANRNTIGGTFQLDNGATLQLSGSNFPLNYTYYTFGTSSTTTYNGTVAQSVGGITYGHLVMTNSGTKTLAAPATVGGNLTINSGATLDGSSHNLTIAGNWVNGGTFTPSTGAVLATGTGKTITGATTFNKLTVYGSYSIINGTATTYNGALTIVSGGSYDAGSGLAVLYGNLSNSGSLTSNGTTTFMGTAVQTLQLLNAINSTSTGIINFNGSVAPVLNSTSTPTFATLNINNTAGVSPSVNWTIGVALNIAAGSSFKGGAATHTILGDFNNLGVVTSTGGLVFAPRSSATANLGANSGGNTFSSDGTVTFSGTGALTVSGTPTKLTNVSIGNSNGVSPSSNWSSVLGTFTVADTAVFNAGANTYTLSGDLESNGRINPGTSHFLFIGAAPEVSGSPNTTFYDVTVNTGAVMLISSEFNVSRHMNINGSIDVNSTASFIMTGSTAANLTGTPTSLALTDFEVAKTNATVTLQKPITGSQSITVSGGTLDIGANTVGVDATNSPNNTLSISDGARLRIGGTSALPAYDAFALDSLSVVEYYGTGNQALTPSALYGSLEITAGTKTTSAALTIQKNVLISTGTFTAGNFTHSVGGDWTQTSGTFTPGTGTIVFNGTGPQTVGATDAFNNITINNASNVSLGTLLKVNGVVDFTAGKLVLGSNNLLPGSITNATSARYIVATGSGVLRQPLAASASKAFPVGTATNYIPATVAFAAGSTADSISVRVLTATYNNGETGSALTNYAVNASWIIDEKVAGGSNASITLQWPAALELPLFSRNTCRLAHYTGGAWNYGVSSLSATGSDPYSVTRSGFTSFSPFSVRMNNAVLPVTFVSFSGQRRGGNDHLTWSTASESNSARFEVEESSDGRSFRAIGTVAAAGSSSTLRTYNYGNNGVQGTRYYRIRQVDLDGRFTYTNVVRLTDDASAVSVRLGANPVPGNTTLQLQVPVATRVQLSLHDGAGRIVWNSSPALGAGSQTIALPTAPLAAGLYYLGIRFEDGSVQTIKLVKE